MPLPANETAERSLLSALFRKPKLLAIVEEKLPSEECFFSNKNQVIYKAMRSLAHAGKDFDWVTTAAEMMRLGDIRYAGGREKAEQYMEELTTATPSTTPITDLADIIKSDFHARQSLARIEETRQQLERGEGSTVQTLSEMQRDVGKILVDADYRPPIPLAEALAASFEDFIERKVDAEKKPDTNIAGLPSGWAELDAVTGGFGPGQVWLFGGDTGQGKSTVGLSIARAVGDTAQDRKGIERIGGAHFITLEMTAEELAEREICRGAGLDTRPFRTGRTTAEEDARLEQSARSAGNCRLLIDDCPKLTIGQLRARIMVTYERYGTELVVLDYLQNVKQDKGWKDRKDHVGEIMESLVELAKEIKISVVALAQLKRRGRPRGLSRQLPPPVVQDLGESSKLEKAAHGIILLHPKPTILNPDDVITDFIVAKNRGAKGNRAVAMLFRRALGRYEPLPASAADGGIDPNVFRSFTEPKGA